ncbi:hypothetical protein A8926_1588 [Saccharopolyspora spinosa]|uniref:Uncharacterized protein n=1 Tax=Saccharopolyspora spinosa TaxID=60894 RepID=A0A2N3XTK8_SACSN|nr:hypothetical protein A8926_1588 [Saccharopolyspora spinosa]
MHRYADLAPLVGVQGNTEGMALHARQGAALVRRPHPAADIVAEIEAEATRALTGLNP